MARESAANTAGSGNGRGSNTTTLARSGSVRGGALAVGRRSDILSAALSAAAFTSAASNTLAVIVASRASGGGRGEEVGSMVGNEASAI